MKVEELANVIAKRNQVSVNVNYFTAKDVAEYIMLYAQHIPLCDNNPQKALENLFSNQ